MLDDAQRLRDKAAIAGIDVDLPISTGMWHNWMLFTPWLPEAQQPIEAIGPFV